MDLLISYLSGLVHSPCSPTNTLCSFLFYFLQHEAEAYLALLLLFYRKTEAGLQPLDFFLSFTS